MNIIKQICIALILLAGLTHSSTLSAHGRGSAFAAGAILGGLGGGLVAASGGYGPYYGPYYGYGPYGYPYGYGYYGRPYYDDDWPY